MQLRKLSIAIIAAAAGAAPAGALGPKDFQVVCQDLSTDELFEVKLAHSTNEPPRIEIDATGTGYLDQIAHDSGLVPATEEEVQGLTIEHLFDYCERRPGSEPIFYCYDRSHGHFTLRDGTEVKFDEYTRVEVQRVTTTTESAFDKRTTDLYQFTVSFVGSHTGGRLEVPFSLHNCKLTAR
jgi:hypothetical protein